MQHNKPGLQGLPEPLPGPAIIGPFEEYRVSVEGFKLPWVKATPLNGENDGLINLSCEGVCVMTTRQEMENWLPFLRHAMMVADRNSSKHDHYHCRMMEIGSIET